MRARCVLTGPLLLRPMASSAHEQHPISLDGEVCSRAARDFRVAGLTVSVSLPFRRSEWPSLRVLERPMEPQLAGRPPPLAACSQRQEPCEPARHGGWFLDPRVLGPRAPELDRHAVAPAWALEVCGALECCRSAVRCARSAARARRTLCIVPGMWCRECGGVVCGGPPSRAYPGLV